MNVTTRRDLILKVADRWNETYGDPRSSYLGADKKKKIGVSLFNLDKQKATEEEVAEIIGNASWTSLRCDQCKKEVSAVITLGEELGWESATASICWNCLESAYKEFQSNATRTDN